MATIITVKLFLVSVVACLVQEGLGDKSCKAGYECKPNECCLSPVVRRGKREESTGYCKPAGDVGQLCYMNNELSQSPPSMRLYYDACPCQPGLACNGTGQVVLPQGEIGECVIIPPAKAKRAASVSCSGPKDCAADECCVNPNEPIGRRKRLAETGQCQKLGQNGDSCLVKYQAAQNMYYQCPCAAGLTCYGAGLYVVPLGETGTCKP